MSIIGAFASRSHSMHNNETTISENLSTKTNELYELFAKYLPPSNDRPTPQVDLPWLDQSMDLLEWWIQIEYKGQLFSKQVPIDITDFKEKFLKHPEYGEILRFNIDSDPGDDLEVIIGFYWSIIKDANGQDVKSLEKRIRVRQLDAGSYIEDPNAELELWSELHINYGLFKQNLGKNKEVFTISNDFIHQIFTQPIIKYLGNNPRILSIIDILQSFIQQKSFSDDVFPTPEDSDYISIGAGYRSPLGEEIPRYTEKRFAFARDKIFSPTIFQHSVDPGSSKGKGPIELLYGFKTYTAGSSTPSYDIGFSVEFNPAVYLKTKFIPLGGHVYYYFNQDSQRNTNTMVTFTTEIAQGSGEEIELSLLFETIDESLGQTGRWMSFDIDMFGDNDPLGGRFHYLASNIFTIDVIVNSPIFEEKIELCELPTRLDLSWDLDFTLLPTSVLFAHAEGYVDVSMSTSLEGINLYYPKTNPSDPDEIFIDVPGGIPRNIRVEASATLNVDIDNPQYSLNYLSGSIKHTCDENIDSIRAFLPGEPTPIIKITEIPAYTEAQAKLYWNGLRGNAYAWRGSSGPPDPIEVTLSYGGYQIHDILTIRNGYIDTRFEIGEDGHFFFDTSEEIFGNELMVSNVDSGDSIGLIVNEISANKLRADWNIDTSGDQLEINELSFGGIVDTLKGLQLNLNYQGKSTLLHLDWILGQTGLFEIQIDQEDDLTIDFSDFAINSSVFYFDGGITISDIIQFDMNWKLKQGDGSSSGGVDPGFFTINEYNDQAMIKHFDFTVTYQDQYGIAVQFDNLQFYLNCEWWRGGRLLPYIWLDYEVSANNFDIDLLWTNAEGETQWYENVEEW